MNRNVCVGVIVLGDIGRSPRMQYHSYSLVKEGFKVKLLGYNESNTSNTLLQNVEIVNVQQPPVLMYLPRLLQFVFKVFWNTVLLLYTLTLNGRFQILLVQNPPAIPTLFVCWFYCKLSRAKLIIDWHNYAYTILSLSVGSRHPLVRVSKIIEKYFGQLADCNICVTKSMKEDLKEKWNINAVTLYDKPGPSFMSSISEDGKLKLFNKLCTMYEEFKLLKSGERVGLLVSSTSWTEDEDFSILLDALSDYNSVESDNLPILLCVITGKGPLKFHYQEEIRRRKWTKVKIVTPWLDPEDYPRLLASANLGVCLHTSSSGLDLPMKVVDMFGSTLPVCAYNYPCLSELLRHDENGLVFENSKQLASQLDLWFRNFPEIQERHRRFRENIAMFQKVDWHQNWRENALPLFIN